jgi:hypothetical protein
MLLPISCERSVQPNTRTVAEFTAAMRQLQRGTNSVATRQHIVEGDGEAIRTDDANRHLRRQLRTTRRHAPHCAHTHRVYCRFRQRKLDRGAADECLQGCSDPNPTDAKKSVHRGPIRL